MSPKVKDMMLKEAHGYEDYDKAAVSRQQEG